MKKAKLNDLAELTSEEWTFSREGATKNGILVNYLAHTYERLEYENKIFVDEKNGRAIFNTGLFDNFYEPLYAYLELNKRENTQKWYTVGFKSAYELARRGVDNTLLPERANYFEDPSLLIFDANCPINIQFGHILNDPNNIKKLTKKIKDATNRTTIFRGALDLMVKSVTANYKLAVPQYYKGNIQLLLPVCLLEPMKADVALVVTKSNDGKYYQGHTCLTLDMAYNNARLIARPNSDWLNVREGK